MHKYKIRMSGVVISEKEARVLGKICNIDYHEVPFDQWLFGLNVELEHGTANELTNVTDNELIPTAKITLAHIMEFPDYYAYLKRMESKLLKKWNKKTLHVFVDDKVPVL
jgi:hypothetical protein